MITKTASHFYSDRIFNIINYLFVIGIGLVVAYPLIFIISSSLSSSNAVISGRVWLWPVEPGFIGYKAIFEHRDIWIGFMNSLFYTFVGTLINIVLTSLAAYPLSRTRMFGKNLIMGIFLIPLVFDAGLIPTYLVVQRLGLVDTRWAMLLPLGMIVWNVFILMSFMSSSIPDELYEASVLDGCDHIRFFTRIVLPLSKAGMAVVVLFYAVMHWNTYFNALIYLSSRNLIPLQIILRKILVLNDIDEILLTSVSKEGIERQNLKEVLKYSLIVVSCLPMLILYPFIQKYFVKGILIGAVKGWGALQRLLTHSYSSKVQAVIRVTNNKGKKTAGVDGVIWKTDKQKKEVVGGLKSRGYKGSGWEQGLSLKTNIAIQKLEDPNAVPFYLPLSCKIGINGLGSMLAQKFKRRWIKRKEINNKIHTVVYADDFVITGKNKN